MVGISRVHTSMRHLRRRLSKEIKKLRAERVPQPGTSVGPFLTCQIDGDLQGAGDLLVAQAGKTAKFDDLAGEGVLVRKTGQGLVQGQQIFITGRCRAVRELDPLSARTSLEPAPAPRVINEDSPHRLGSRGEEVTAIVE